MSKYKQSIDHYGVAAYNPNSTWLVSTRLDTFDVSSESRRACRAVLFQHGGRRTSYSARLYKLVVLCSYIGLHKSFVPPNKIN